jgi:RNA polymerase sigma-70 factor, ECF subfamily
VTRTPASLLERLRTSPDDDAWGRFVDLYGPLIYQWVRVHFHLHEPDAEDVTQEVLTTVVREMPGFRYEPRGSFRGCLFRIVQNRVLRLQRGRKLILVDPNNLDRHMEEGQGPDSALAQRWQDEHDRMVLGRALALIRREFEEATWQAFAKTVLDGQAPRQAAKQMEMSPNAVRIAKCRVLRRLRQEIEGLIE